MVEKLFLGRISGDKVVFSKNEFGEYEIARREGRVEFEVYYNPEKDLIEVVNDGKVVATSDTLGSLKFQLLKDNIDLSEVDLMNLPKVGQIWIPKEVEEKKRYLERFSKEGTRVVTEEPDKVITRTVFKLSDNEYEEVEFRYEKGDDFAEVTKTKYYIVRDTNGKETIRLIWWHQIVNLF